ncbi:MAG: hypothetical protein ACT4QF_04515 [Sporichthyaceae bacterium]
MSPPTPEESLRTVEAFVVRARRVLAHSLAQDFAALMRLADGSMEVVRAGNVLSLEQPLPDEEALESLAARVRPLVLQDDPVHYDKVLNALSRLLRQRGDAGDVEWCRELKRDWRSVDLSREDVVGYRLSTWSAVSPEPPVAVSDSALAIGWFYGDLVHADSNAIRVGEHFPIKHRFAAAAVRVAQLVILARDTLSFISALAEAGAIQFESDTSTSVEVVVVGHALELVGLHLAPLGTEIPNGGTAPPSDWTAMSGPWLGDGPDGRWLLPVRVPWARENTDTPLVSTAGRAVLLAAARWKALASSESSPSRP